MPQTNVFFTQDEIVYQFFCRQDEEMIKAKKSARKQKEKSEEIKVENIRLRFKGANKSVMVEGLEKNEEMMSYFRGDDPRKWVRIVGTCQKVRYKELYPHIDLIVYGSGRKVKHEYRVRTGGEVEKIGVRYI